MDFCSLLVAHSHFCVAHESRPILCVDCTLFALLTSPDAETGERKAVQPQQLMILMMPEAHLMRTAGHGFELAV